MKLFRTRLIFVALLALLASVVDHAWAVTGQTLFTTQIPGDYNEHAGSNSEKGLAFYSVAAGQITAVRFWKSSNESGTHVGRIWSSGGTLLASVTFANETASGWQQQSLASPLSISANTTYIVSVNTGNTYYVDWDGGLQTQVVNGNLRSVVGNNGRYGSSGQFPSNGTDGTNFFRDVVFVPASVSSLASVALSPSSVNGGSSSTGTVTLTSPAPSGGAVVTLSSNNAAATVPASVTVGAGSTTGTFAVATSAVGATTLATISGSYNGSKSATLTINSPVLSTISLNPTSVTGGSSSTGTVTLTRPAPAGGALVMLSSDDAAAVVPASVTVGAGLTTGTFTVNTSAVGATTSASISGSYNGSKSATLTIYSPVLSMISLNPNSVTGGTASTGTAILTGPAPAGGTVVELSGANPTFAGIQGVHSAVDLPQDGSVDWSTTGPQFGLLPSSALSVAGMPGSTLTVTTATALAPQIFNNCSTGGNCGWYGNFAPGAGVLWVRGTYNGLTGAWVPNGPLTISLNSPQHGLGFQIMADEVGSFTATVCAYSSTDESLGCVPFNGNSSGVADDSAVYIGLYDDVAEISRITIDAGGPLYPHDFAIGRVYVANTRRQLVPASVTVPAGAASATFAVTANSVNTSTSVNISGSYGASRTATLNIHP